jgi:hypothetical protein
VIKLHKKKHWVKSTVTNISNDGIVISNNYLLHRGCHIYPNNER